MKSIKFDDWNQRRELLEKIDLFREFSRFDIPKIAELYHHVVFFEKNFYNVLREHKNLEKKISDFLQI